MKTKHHQKTKVEKDSRTNIKGNTVYNSSVSQKGIPFILLEAPFRRGNGNFCRKSSKIGSDGPGHQSR